jgi:hypothetical protein
MDTIDRTGQPACREIDQPEGAETASIDEMIGSYVASWNESDPTKRRLTIEKTWSPDGIYRNATAEPPEIASASITRARRRRGRRLRR